MKSDWQKDIEHRFEVNYGWLKTAKYVQEIPPERAESLSDTMAAIELVGKYYPWTFSAFTGRGLERKMRRFERKENIVATRVEAT